MNTFWRTLMLAAPAVALVWSTIVTVRLRNFARRTPRIVSAGDEAAQKRLLRARPNAVAMVSLLVAPFVALQGLKGQRAALALDVTLAIPLATLAFFAFLMIRPAEQAVRALPRGSGEA